MITAVDVEAGRKLIEKFRCGECNSRLSIAWGGHFGVSSYILRCGRDANHRTIQRIPWERPGYDGEQRRWVPMSTEQETRTFPAIRGVVATLTQALARVDEAEQAGLWPGRLGPAQKRLLAQATLAYGLDPLMQELTVFQGKPLVTIRGRRRKDAAAGHHPSIRFRFLTPDEKAGFTEAGAFHDEDLAMYCILTTEDGNTVEGFGKVTAAERVATSQRSQDPQKRAHPIVDDNPIEMCQKRAEDRARMMAYGPIPVPTSFLAEVLSEYQVGESAPADATTVGSSAATEARPGESAEYFCADHNDYFERRERDGRVWYSHRVEGGGWHNMKEPPQEGPPTTDEPFDPATAPPPPLPASVTALSHLIAVLRDNGWTKDQFEIKVLNTSFETYLKTYTVNDAYQLFKRWRHGDSGL